MVAAASSCVNLRVATFEINPKRFDFPVSNNARVSAERKLLITREQYNA